MHSVRSQWQDRILLIDHTYRGSSKIKYRATEDKIEPHTRLSEGWSSSCSDHFFSRSYSPSLSFLRTFIIGKPPWPPPLHAHPLAPYQPIGTPTLPPSVLLPHPNPPLHRFPPAQRHPIHILNHESHHLLQPIAMTRRWMLTALHCLNLIPPH